MTNIYSRRTVVGGAAALLLPASLGAANRDEGPIVRVREGLLRGRAAGGVVRFLGVPYAAPPVGKRRFLPPAPAAAWRGVRDAAAFGDAPVQSEPPTVLAISRRDYLGADCSEDCLKLNIWAPATPGRYPVLVWIHGGGNMGGAASQAPFDGAVFAREGVVCVTIGYRVGTLGFLELGGLLGDRYRGSGNNGLRDQLAALRWVRVNIAAFGGDPARVTLAGQSAGGKDVAALLASPLSRGLVRSAIVHSGGETVHDVAAADRVAALFSAAMATAGRAPADLLTMSPNALLAVQSSAIARFDRPWPFRAVVGTDVLPVAPIAAFKAGAAAHVRLMIGTNADESIVFLDRAAALRPLTQQVLANFSLDAALPVAARYDAAYPNLDPLRRRVRLVTAEEYGLASFRLAEAHARGGAGTWMYRFTRPVRGGPFAGWTPHGAELPYVWDAVAGSPGRAPGEPATAEVLALRNRVRSSWLAFIRGEEPWAPYRGGTIMEFGSAPRLSLVDRAEYAMWDGAWPR